MKICINCGKEHNNKSFCSRTCNMSYTNKNRVITDDWRRTNSVSKIGIGHKQKQETKDKISIGMKNYLKNNPDKLNWIKDRMKSEPCEIFKTILKSKNLFFIEELKPLNERNFSIDIALPEYKIGIEINGNQHYKSGNVLLLKDYYRIRHELIEKEGWKLIELHYKTVFDKNIENIIDSIIIERDHNYSIETKNYLIDCINRIKFCKKCKKEIINKKCDFCK